MDKSDANQPEGIKGLRPQSFIFITTDQGSLRNSTQKNLCFKTFLRAAVHSGYSGYDFFY